MVKRSLLGAERVSKRRRIKVDDDDIDVEDNVDMVVNSGGSSNAPVIINENDGDYIQDADEIDITPALNHSQQQRTLTRRRRQHINESNGNHNSRDSRNGHVVLDNDDGGEDDYGGLHHDAEIDSEGEDESQGSVQMHPTSRDVFASSGIISSIRLDRFMSHRCFDWDLGPNVNIVNGSNGSGKSAIVAALQLGLGARPGHTERGSKLEDHIMHGESNAIITINIKNCKGSETADMTFKHGVYGDMITIERKLFRGRAGRSGSSTWAVKGSNHHHVKLPEGTTARKEVLDIIDHFGFMVNNPVAILTQTKSKAFLAKGKPVEHYKLYREATLLEPLQNELIEIINLVEHVDEMVKKSEANQPTSVKQLEKLEAAHKDAQEMKNINQRIKEAVVLLAWTEHYEEEYNLQTREQRTQAEFEPKEARARQRLDMATAKLDDFNREVQEKQATSDEVSQTVRFATDARRNAQIEYTKIKSEVSSIRGRISEIDREERENDRQVEREQARMEQARRNHFKGQEQKTRLIEELRQVQEEQKEVMDRVNQAKAENADFDTQRMEFKEDMARLVDRNRRLEMERENKYRDYAQQERDAQNRNNLARFGRDVPEIVETIRRNLNKFQMPPIGPLGQYIKLKDESWATAIELCIQRNTLCSFLVLDSRDERTLLSLLPRHIRRPSVYIVNLRNSRYTISPQTVPDVARFGFCTVLDQVNVDNDVAFNALVDFANVEQLVLNDKEDITKLAWSHAPNIKSVWNKHGEHATSRGGSKVFRAAPRNYGAHYLTEDTTRYLDILRREVQELETEAENSKRAIQECQAKQHQLSRNSQGLRQRIQQGETRRYELERKRQSIEDQLSRAEDAFDPTPYERSIDDLKARKEGLIMEKQQREEELRMVQQKVTDCNRTLQDSKARLEKARREAANFQGIMEDLFSRVGKAKSAVRQLRRDHEEAKHKLDSANAELNQRRNKVAEMRNVAENAGPEPDNIDINEMSSLKVTRRVEMLKTRLRTEQKRRGGKTAEDIEKEYLKAQRQHNENVSKLIRVKGYYKSLSRGVKARGNNLKRLEKSLRKMVRFNFRKFLSTRNHDGNILFTTDNNENRELVISTKMASHNKGDGERHETKDLRSLSGGERSFTTLCFMMALAEICQNPIRVLDEIDVFQDEANRRASFKILVEFFQNFLSDKQVIIITPHSLPNISSSQSCRIVKLAAPRRGTNDAGQRTIDDFMGSTASTAS